MSDRFTPSSSWRLKFANAWRGVHTGVRGESSFAVHLPAGFAVGAVAWWLQIQRGEALLLLLCVFSVWAAELFNSSLERLAKAVDVNENAHIRDALDIASGGVLVVSIGASLVGLAVLLPPLVATLTE